MQIIYILHILAVPSKVAILHVMPLSSSEVNLLWTEPVQPKGVIKEYVIYLKVC